MPCGKTALRSVWGQAPREVVVFDLKSVVLAGYRVWPSFREHEVLSWECHAEIVLWVECGEITIYPRKNITLRSRNCRKSAAFLPQKCRFSAAFLPHFCRLWQTGCELYCHSGLVCCIRPSTRPSTRPGWNWNGHALSLKSATV